MKSASLHSFHESHTEPTEIRIPFQTLVHEMLEQLGEDPTREGLRQTPARVEASLKWLTRGYGMKVDEVIGDAPLLLDNLKVGESVTLTLKLKGFKDKVETFTVEKPTSKKTVTMKFKLEKEKKVVKPPPDGSGQTKPPPDEGTVDPDDLE